jgi:pectinesterase
MLFRLVWHSNAKTYYITCDLDSRLTIEGGNRWNGDAMFPDKEKTAYYAVYTNPGAWDNY